MIVYYDIVDGREIASDSYDETDIKVPGVKCIVSSRVTVSEGEINIGANASAEDAEDEGVDASEARTVINVVEAAHLQQVQIDKKEYKTLQNAYWKKLLAALNRNKFDVLGFDEDYVAPKDKAEAKKAEEDAAAKLNAYQKNQLVEAEKRITDFKANFDGLQKFVNDTIYKNFEEYDFYTVEEGVLGSCMIVPARFEGESTAPLFYLFTDGVREKKE